MKKSRQASFYLAASILAGSATWMAAQNQPKPLVAPTNATGIFTNPTQIINPNRPQRVEAPPQTEEEKKAAEILKEQSKEINALYPKMRQARADLDKVIYADKLDETAIQAKSEAIAKIEGEMALVKGKYFAKLREFLPPDKLERYKPRTATSPIPSAGIRPFGRTNLTAPRPVAPIAKPERTAPPK